MALVGARMTLEQLRAQNAWQCVRHGVDKDYVNVAKALPALIMNSGLLQVMAFLQQKESVHRKVAASLRIWLWSRKTGRQQTMEDPGFERFMDSLMAETPSGFQALTAEALAWLKWLRQLAAAAQER